MSDQKINNKTNDNNKELQTKAAHIQLFVRC